MKNFYINAERLVLRPLTTEYLTGAHKFLSDLDNTKLTKYFPTESEEETEAFLLKCQAEWQKPMPTFFEFAVNLQGRIIGKVSLYLSEDRTEGNIGWIFDKDYWGRGYAYEAASAVKKFAFSSLKLKRMIARCDYRNQSSIALAKKLGLVLQKEGVRKNRSSAAESKEYTFFTDKA